MSRRTVLVTGAAGFVGGALVRGFAQRGWNVCAVDKSSGAPIEGVGWVEADLANGLPEGVDRPDLLVHGAWTTADPATLGVDDDGYAAMNLAPLTSVLVWATQVGVPHFVFLSSSGVFSADDGADGLTDDVEPTGSSPYALAKREGESRTSDSQLESAFVVRLGYLFGPTEEPNSTRPSVSLATGYIERARAGEPLRVRSDDPPREWTFAPDLAEAIERLVDGPPCPRPVHLGSPHVLRDSELARLVTEHMPGAEIESVAPTRRQKAPMVGSRVPALTGYRWTHPKDGIAAVLATELVP